MNFFKLTLFIAVLGWALLACQPEQRPNIILIMADDLGYETLSVYGGTDYSTPSLDRLAEEGLVFTNCYSTPLCTPSRVKLMTGKYNYRNYVGFGILDSTETTFAHSMKSRGYKTVIAGKWQLFGDQKQFNLAKQHGTTPEQAGFDEYLLWQVKDRGFRYKSPTLASNKGLETFADQYGPDLFLQFIEGFIERNKQGPFFVYYPMVLTHDPFQVTPDNGNFSSFNPDSTSMNDTTYFRDNVSYMDKIVGKIRDKVEAAGIANNTLILFIGDNGTDRDVISDFRAQRIRGMKGYPVEYGTHVPFIAYWKGTIEGGRTSESLVDFTDFHATLLALTGKNSRESLNLDGYDLSGEFYSTDLSDRQWIFTSYSPRWGNFDDARMVHDGQFKLYDDGKAFNILKDPHETRNVFDSLQRSEPDRIHQFQVVLKSLK